MSVAFPVDLVSLKYDFLCSVATVLIKFSLIMFYCIFIYVA